MVRNLPARTEDMGLIHGSGRSPGVGNGNPLQYSCLENPIVRGTWRVQSMESQRVGHDLVTKQQVNILIAYPSHFAHVFL